MTGFWFTVMVAGVILVGVAVQVGWQLPSTVAVRRVCRRALPRARVVGGDAELPKLL